MAHTSALRWLVAPGPAAVRAAVPRADATLGAHAAAVGLRQSVVMVGLVVLPVIADGCARVPMRERLTVRRRRLLGVRPTLLRLLDVLLSIIRRAGLIAVRTGIEARVLVGARVTPPLIALARVRRHQLVRGASLGRAGIVLGVTAGAETSTRLSPRISMVKHM
jgi:hypothetical protein